MRGTLTAKKGTGLDDIFKSYTPQHLEEMTKTESSYHGPLWKKYRALLAHYDLDEVKKYFAQEGTSMDTFEEKIEQLLKQIPQVFTPQQIDAFLASTIACEHEKEYKSGTGVFISHLIQNSYKANHNNFVLHTSSIPHLRTLGVGLQGTAQRPLNLTVHGYGGDVLAARSRYCDYVVYGDTGRACGYMTNCTLEIFGDSHINLAQSTDSTFIFHGKVLIRNTECLGFQEPQGCHYITTDKETYQRLWCEVPTGNSISFIPSISGMAFDHRSK